MGQEGARAAATGAQVRMRKLVAGLFVSLDGVVEIAEQAILPYFNDEVVELIQSDQDAADTILLGRRTYQEFAAYWPEKSGADDPFANYINRTPKVVVSRTLKTVDWQNTTLIGDYFVDGLARLKRRPGKEISVAGSATLVRSLLRHGLIDELRLLMFPIVLGSGKRLFDPWTGELPMTLVGARSLTNGVLSLLYAPAK